MFMPSEIARLVLGYLKDAGCTQAVNLYLTENVHLSEYVACLKQGYEYPTTIAGQSLADILKDYCQLKAAEQTPAGQVRTTPAITNTPSQVTVTANNIQNSSIATTSQSSSAVRFISASTNTDDVTESRQVENEKTMVDCGTQMNEYPASNNDITSVGTPGVVDIPDNASQASASCSTLTPSSYSRSCWSTTPNRKQVDFYSSPTSMVKSAMMYNFDIETFRTPAKARYSTDTPSKDRYLDEDGTWKSPRRKNQLPRKRLSYTPLSALKTNVTITTTPDESEGHSNDNIDVTALIDKLLHNTALQERIADNINKAVSHTTQVAIAVTNASPSNKQSTSSTNDKVSGQELPRTIEPASNVQISAQPPPQVTIDEQMPDAVIKQIVDRTESDPAFEAFLNLFYDKHENSSRDSQLLGGCSEYTASPDTHGTPLAVAESTGSFSVNCTPMSESANTPKTAARSPCVSVVQGTPDSSVVIVGSSISDYCPTPNSELSTHCPSSVEYSMVSPYQNVASPKEAPSETFPIVSNQSVTYSQILTYLPPHSNTNSVLSTTAAYNTPLTTAQLSSTSVMQNIAHLQYTNAPSTSSAPSGTLSYFPTVVPALNQSKLPTIFFPFYPNSGSIVGPVVTTRPATPTTSLPACVTLPQENGSAAPIQYFKLNLQGQNLPDVTSQSNSKSFTQVQIVHGNKTNSSTVRAKRGGKNTRKAAPNLPNRQSERILNKTATPCPVPQPSTFVEVASEIEKPIEECSVQDCNSNLSELLLTTTTAPTVTLYGQDMQEHHMDSSSFQKLLSNTSISVAGNLISLTPVKSSSTLQFITLSPGAILPLANTTSAPAKPQTLNEAINNSNHDVNRCSSSTQRPNILRQKPTKYKTGNRKVEKGVAINPTVALTRKSKKTLAKNLNFSKSNPVEKEMQMEASKSNVTSKENTNKATSQQTSDKVENRKSPDCHIVAISKGIPKSMPVLENVRIVKTFAANCIGSNEKSPQLTSLIQSANLFKAAHQAQDGAQTASHVRALDFSDTRNPVRNQDSQKNLNLNAKNWNSVLKPKETIVSNKPGAKRKSQKVDEISKDLTKNCQNLSKEKAKGKPGDESCQKDTQILSRSKDGSRRSANEAITSSEAPSSSHNPKKRTANQVNLKNDRTPAKKLKGVAPGKVLSVMDIDKFLSGLRYEQ